MDSSQGSPDAGFTESFEGYADAQPDGSCVAYWDSLGSVWTIAFGLTGSGITKGTHWTRAFSEQQFSVRWLQVHAQVLKQSPILSQFPQRWIAITDFAYNEGIANYIASTLRRKVNAQDWTGAAAELPKWKLAGGKVVNGLVRRRAAEAQLFLGPQTALASVLQPAPETNQTSVPDDAPLPSLIHQLWNVLLDWLMKKNGR